MILVFSSLLLVWSSGLLIKQTQELSYRLRLSKLFISLVLIALGTSLPELTVSSVAMSLNDPGLALSGIIGSNITNVTLILGIAILINRFRVGTTKTQQNAWLLIFVTGLFVVLYMLPISVSAIGLLLIGVAIGTIVWQYVKAVQGRTNEDKLFFVHIPKYHVSVWKVVGKTFVGLVALVVSGSLLVISIEHISQILNISTTILGMTMVALATSLPELVSTVIAQKQGEEKIVMGNLLGSNIYNLAFIGGVMSLNLPYPIKFGLGAGILVVATLVFFWIVKVWKGRHVPKVVGIGLVLGYVVYLVGILIF